MHSHVQGSGMTISNVGLICSTKVFCPDAHPDAIDDAFRSQEESIYVQLALTLTRPQSNKPRAGAATYYIVVHKSTTVNVCH